MKPHTTTDRRLFLLLLGVVLLLASAPGLAQQAEKTGAPAPATQAAPPAPPAPAVTPSAPAPAGAPGAPGSDQAKEQEAFDLGVEAYIYGYPLVTMEMTRRVMTNVAKPEGKAAPMGQLARLRAYPSAADKEVTAPNADTLYTLAWLDVTQEPWVLSLPDMKGRYYLMPLLDGWTEVFQVPGKRTTGTKAQTYAITGPGWQGHAAQGGDGVQIPHQHGVGPGAHLLHRHPGGLQGGARLAGQVQAGALKLLRQALYAAPGAGGPRD